jgi:hypothetical protein
MSRTSREDHPAFIDYEDDPEVDGALEVIGFLHDAAAAIMDLEPIEVERLAEPDEFGTLERLENAGFRVQHS